MGNSSARPNSLSPATSDGTQPHKAFALTGRSRPLDPRTNAVRPDIADVRLAEYVFAPHYAAATPRTIAVGTSLREGRASDSEEMARLQVGDPFELLDVTGGVAWGIATGHGLVGYVDAVAIEAAG